MLMDPCTAQREYCMCYRQGDRTPWRGRRAIVLWYPREAWDDPLVSGGYYFGEGRSSLSAILTRSASEVARILCMICPRWRFTVISLVPNSAATCLLSSPVTTRPN